MNKSENAVVVILEELIQLTSLLQNINKQLERNSLGLTQWFVLKKLVDLPSTSALKLANALNIHPSTLTQSLSRLSRKKFIFISKNPSDHRKKIISITREGNLAMQKTELFLKEHFNELKLENPDVFHISSLLKKKMF